MLILGKIKFLTYQITKENKIEGNIFGRLFKIYRVQAA